MKLIGGAVLAGVIVFSVSPSYAQMMDRMDKHMEEHMGGMNRKADSKKAEKGYTQEAEAAGVTVKATYTNPGGETPVFTVVLDTHSVDLEGYKFEEIVILRDDEGNVYRPFPVSQSGSGHHRAATVEFKDTAPLQSKAFELVVKGVAGVDERVFKFDIQKKMGSDDPADNGK